MQENESQHICIHISLHTFHVMLITTGHGSRCVSNPGSYREEPRQVLEGPGPRHLKSPFGRALEVHGPRQRAQGRLEMDRPRPFNGQWGPFKGPWRPLSPTSLWPMCNVRVALFCCGVLRFRLGMREGCSLCYQQVLVSVMCGLLCVDFIVRRV